MENISIASGDEKRTTFLLQIKALFHNQTFITFYMVTLAGILGFGLASRKTVDLKIVFEEFQWGVLIIYFVMDRFTSLALETGIMQGMAIRLARFSRGHRWLIMALFSLLLFLISAFLNNLTAVLVVLPILFVLLEAITLDRFFHYQPLFVIARNIQSGRRGNAYWGFPCNYYHEITTHLLY
ncbi:MAG: hypothetical protein LWX08_13810 [Deltaproteobacteria bacterium]|jgi:Na+/H+ antiporter NhaD/arsenite permease-like protein|nr:hypothetical protein [Deltaproteobacteria bacterium]